MNVVNYNDSFGWHNRWTEQAILWYEKASEYTGYHKFIMNYIGELFKPGDSVCELACGSGSLALEIAPLVTKVTANDLNADAINHLEKVLREKKIPNIDPVLGDWREVCAKEKYDVLIYSYYSAMLNDWDILKSITRRKVIAILPSEINQKNIRERETFEQVKTKLEKLNVYHTAIPVTVDFGQPFDDRNQAREYLKHYYRFENGAEMESFIDNKMKTLSMIVDKSQTNDSSDNEGLYFPKIKKIGIIIADMR